MRPDDPEANLPAEELPEYLEDVPESEPAQPPRASALRFARMAGSSIAGRDAAPWVTDFLNAACYRRPVEERDVDDLRLAFAIITTYWYRQAADRRLHVTDLPAFHGAFGRHRFETEQAGRGTLSRAQLVEGAARLLGDWFPDAYADDARRGWGIAFETPDQKDAHDPTRPLPLPRLRGAPPP